jgi:hypothetical protein
MIIGRRELIAALGGAAVWPLSARAQQGERMRRIGILNGFAAEKDKFGSRHSGTACRNRAGARAIICRLSIARLVPMQDASRLLQGNWSPHHRA